MYNKWQSGKCGLRDNRPTLPNILKKVSGMAASESKLFAHANKVVYIVSQYLWTKLEDVEGRWVLFKGLFARREDYSRTHTFPLLIHRRVYKAARVTWIGGLPCLRGRWVNFFPCKHSR